MMNLIPIHDVATSVYVQLAFCLLAVGNHAFTEYIYYRYALWTYTTYLSLSAAIKVLLVIWGACLFPSFFLINSYRVDMALMYLLLGWFIANLLFHLERYSVTSLNRSRLALLHQPSFRKSIVRTFYDANTVSKKNHTTIDTLCALLLTALCEELLLRCFVLSLVLRQLSLFSASFMLQVLAILFACAHVKEGIVQVICKWHFAFIMTMSVLLTHTTMTAMSAHLFFNFYVWTYLRKQASAYTAHKICSTHLSD